MRRVGLYVAEGLAEGVIVVDVACSWRLGRAARPRRVQLHTCQREDMPWEGHDAVDPHDGSHPGAASTCIVPTVLVLLVLLQRYSTHGIFDSPHTACCPLTISTGVWAGAQRCACTWAMPLGGCACGVCGVLDCRVWHSRTMYVGRCSPAPYSEVGDMTKLNTPTTPNTALESESNYLSKPTLVCVMATHRSSVVGGCAHCRTT